jgi:hypothetical protein
MNKLDCGDKGIYKKIADSKKSQFGQQGPNA